MRISRRFFLEAVGSGLLAVAEVPVLAAVDRTRIAPEPLPAGGRIELFTGGGTRLVSVPLAVELLPAGVRLTGHDDADLTGLPSEARWTLPTGRVLTGTAGPFPDDDIQVLPPCITLGARVSMDMSIVFEQGTSGGTVSSGMLQQRAMKLLGGMGSLEDFNRSR